MTYLFIAISCIAFVFALMYANSKFTTDDREMISDRSPEEVPTPFEEGHYRDPAQDIMLDHVEVEDLESDDADEEEDAQHHYD